MSNDSNRKSKQDDTKRDLTNEYRGLWSIIETMFRRDVSEICSNPAE